MRLFVAGVSAAFTAMLCWLLFGEIMGGSTPLRFNNKYAAVFAFAGVGDAFCVALRTIIRELRK